jgi:polyhydroxyalkanoate synthesis regulator phasin
MNKYLIYGIGLATGAFFGLGIGAACSEKMKHASDLFQYGVCRVGKMAQENSPKCVQNLVETVAAAQAGKSREELNFEANYMMKQLEERLRDYESSD